MIRSNKKSRNRGVSRSRLSTKLPFFSSALSSNSTNECCGKIVTYTPTSKEIKRKRGRGYGREKDDGEKRETTRAREKRRGGRENFHLREYTRCYTLGRSCAPPGEGTAFLGRLTRCARPGQTEGRRLLLLERNARRVATIPLCISFGRPLWDTSTHTLCPQTAPG